MDDTEASRQGAGKATGAANPLRRKWVAPTVILSTEVGTGTAIPSIPTPVDFTSPGLNFGS